MAQVEVVPVESPKALAEFVEFPYRHYRRDPYWVPPLRIAQKEILDQRRHPFYAEAEMQCFLARREGRTVGRIAGIVDHKYNRFRGENIGAFGFFESVESEEVAGQLAGRAAAWVKARGVTTMRGPFNPSTNYEIGTLIEGFDSSPQIMMTYNPPYYPRILEAAGLRKAKDVLAYTLETNAVVEQRVGRIARRVQQASGVRIRPIRMRHFQEDVEMVWDVYNAAWNRNWGFVPMSREEFFLSARDMKTILQPEFVLLGEVNGKVVGFALALPNINLLLKGTGGRLFPWGLPKLLLFRRSIRSLRVLALGVVKEYQSAGVAASFYAELIRNARRLGYQGAELSWILEDNVLMNRSLRELGARRYKTYRIYEWN